MTRSLLDRQSELLRSVLLFRYTPGGMYSTEEVVITNFIAWMRRRIGATP